jgi:hypothetical protein
MTFRMLNISHGMAEGRANDKLENIFQGRVAAYLQVLFRCNIRVRYPVVMAK